MSTEQRIVDYICEQANLPGLLSYRKMFGEYALYMDGKVIALICDNQLYLKPTTEGKAVLNKTTDAPPYPGAKLHYQLGDEIEDRDLLSSAFRATWAALPMPAPKKPKPVKMVKASGKSRRK